MKFWNMLVALLLCSALILPSAAASGQDDTASTVSKQTLLAGLMDADIRSIQAAYTAGLVTCYEVTAYYLERVSTYNDRYNCFISLCDDALDQALRIDEQIVSGNTQGLLLGIPVVIKDNMDYAGYYTTNGYSKTSSYIADDHAQVVDYLLQEGAVIVGKANMSTGADNARACYSIAVGETKNAYNWELASGGSSGGSAVATSLNFAVAGLGTDTNSSLRLPAVLNGCVSMRVTWDTLSLDGIVKLNSRRDVPGAITRTVLDQAIILDALSGGETSYAKNLDSGALEGLRLGVVQELTYQEDAVDAEVEAAFENALAELEACGAVVVTVSVPGVSSWFYCYDDSTAFRQGKLEQLEQIMKENAISAFVFPSYLSTPQYSGTDANGTYWSTANQSFINNTSKFSSNVGIPEIGLPIGYHSRGAGIGMEIAALQDQEQLLLNIAYAYTQAYDHRNIPEEAVDLYTQWYEGTLADLTVDYYYAQAKRRQANDTQAEMQTGQLQDPALAENSGWKKTVVVIVGVSLLLPAVLLWKVLRFRGKRPGKYVAKKKAQPHINDMHK